jgi:predicted TIM-barrel fold metal-dependent hydrolase
MTEPIEYLISVDDHVVEPTHVWEERLPARFRDRGPRWVAGSDGIEAWEYDGKRLPIGGTLTVAQNWARDDWTAAPVRIQDLHPSMWDPVERLKAMDADGVYGSLLFPTFPRFCGQTFYEGTDRELGLLSVQAYNDWMIDEWCATAPSRFRPLIILPLWDARLAAAEVERCAAKGAAAVNFSENPSKLRLPSIHDKDDYWDPVFSAAADAGMPLCIHIGSSSFSPTTSADCPTMVPAVLLGFVAQATFTDWLFSGKFNRFPQLKVVLSEGGISWIPGTLHFAQRKIARVGHMAVSAAGLATTQAQIKRTLGGAGEYNPRLLETLEDPFEIFRNHMYGCMLADDFGWDAMDHIGTANVMVESDYPHSDTSYPNSLDLVRKQLSHLPDADQRAVAHGNAERVFGWAPADVSQIPGFHL